MTKIIFTALFSLILPTVILAQGQSPLERRSNLFGKLQGQLPEVTLNNTTLDEAIEFLRLRALELDRDKPPVGINFVLNHPNPEKALVKDLDLTKTTFADALGAICLQTKTNFQIEEYAVVISPLDAPKKGAPEEEMIQRRWLTPATFLHFITPPAGQIQEIGVSKLLEALGVPFPEGASASYLSASSTLIVRNTAASLDAIDQIVGASQNPGKMAMDQRAMNRILLGEVNFYNTTLEEALQFLHLRSGKHAKIKIAGDDRKLAATVINSLSLKNVPLPAALKYLCQLSGAHFLQHGSSFVILPGKP